MTDNWSTVTHKKKASIRSTSTSTPQLTPLQLPKLSQPTYQWTDTVVLKKSLPPPMVKMGRIATPNTNNQSVDVSRYRRQVEDDAEEGIFAKKTYTTAFRQKLITARKNLGNLTQRQFAQRFNLNESAIKGIENGTGNYDPTLVSKITNQLNRLVQTQKINSK